MNKWLKVLMIVLVVTSLALTVGAVSAQMGRGFRGGGEGGTMWTVVAEQLDMEVDDLFVELRAGKTVADLAAEKGIEMNTIVDAVLALHQEHMAANGNLTQEQIDAALETMREHVTAHFTGDSAYFAGSGMMAGRGQMGHGPMHGRMGGMMGRGMGMGMMGAGHHFEDCPFMNEELPTPESDS